MGRVMALHTELPRPVGRAAGRAGGRAGEGERERERERDREREERERERERERAGIDSCQVSANKREKALACQECRRARAATHVLGGGGRTGCAAVVEEVGVGVVLALTCFRAPAEPASARTHYTNGRRVSEANQRRGRHRASSLTSACPPVRPRPPHAPGCASRSRRFDPRPQTKRPQHARAPTCAPPHERPHMRAPHMRTRTADEELPKLEEGKAFESDDLEHGEGQNGRRCQRKAEHWGGSNQ